MIHVDGTKVASGEVVSPRPRSLAASLEFADRDIVPPLRLHHVATAGDDAIEQVPVAEDRDDAE